MKRIALYAVLLLSCSCHRGAGNSHAVRDRHEIDRLMEAHLKQGEPYTQGRLNPAYGFEFRGPMTIEQLEQEILERENKSSFPSDFIQITNDRWLAPRGHRYREGDVFYFFRTGKRSWDNLVGSEGYLLLREGQIIDILILLVQ